MYVWQHYPQCYFDGAPVNIARARISWKIVLFVCSGFFVRCKSCIKMFLYSPPGFESVFSFFFGVFLPLALEPIYYFPGGSQLSPSCLFTIFVCSGLDISGYYHNKNSM